MLLFSYSYLHQDINHQSSMSKLIRTFTAIPKELFRLNNGRRKALQSSPPKTSDTSGISYTETITLRNRNRQFSIKCTK